MSGALEVVRAGAGSGKTTDLCQVVAEAVKAGLDPARILATTFTRKAAVQLKGRVQARLLESDGVDPQTAHAWADRLELAAIGTVHSVAHQLITRQAIAMGLSPQLTVLDDEGSDRALNNLLGEAAEGWDDVYEVADRLAMQDIPKLILSLLALQRGNRISNADFQKQLAASAGRLCQLLAATPEATGVSFDQLYNLVDDALRQIEGAGDDTTKKTQEAVRKLQRLVARRAQAWQSHLLAGKIEAAKKSDGLLDNLRTETSRVRANPELHVDVKSLAAQLGAKTIELGERYLRYKQERGLVDFTDLEVLLLDLLENEQLAASLQSDYDLVLVDEFQDTNPLQLAIFQRLREVTPRSRWVGDPKQAIYGFRHADPALVNTVWDSAEDSKRESLPNNYRAQCGLVQLIGDIFGPVLGEDARQEPQRSAEPKGIERWLVDAGNVTDEALAVGCGIAQLHTEGIAYRDIAVLARTNLQVSQLAAALDELGIPYLLESPGLLATREGAMVLAGLRLVADRGDSLAAATLLHLLEDPDVETPQWFSERLTEVQNNKASGNKDAYRPPWDEDARLQPLEYIDARTLPPTVTMQRVIEAVGAAERIAKWGDPSRRSGHLDSLLAHATEYERLAVDEGRAATLTGLILYLEGLAADGADLRHAPLGHDAVTLLTYHTAKGLEWPAVVLTGLDYSRDADMWSPSVVADGIDPDDPLHGRSVRYWSWPFGVSDGPYGKRVSGSGLQQGALASAEGASKSRSEADESLRLLYVGFSRARNKLVLAHRDGKCGWLDQLPDVDRLLPPGLAAGEHPIDGVDTTLLVRTLDASLVGACKVSRKEQERWFAAAPEVNATEHVERYHWPSEAAPATAAMFDAVVISEHPSFPLGASENYFAAIGEAVHTYFAALPSLIEASHEVKMTVATRCLAGFGVSHLLTADALVKQGDAFSDWVEAQYPGATWHSEMPVSAPRADGGQWVGAIDLVLETTNGEAIVVDHKSAPIRREQCAAKAQTYSGQLQAYAEILGELGVCVAGTVVHFPLAGVVCPVRYAR
ncbi:UvrD-helicase domain-containing protein [Aeoliella sp. ICT_H6.2]|uniref:DNA 3'-5' helicase n=1 Tax=Aeoliella straminimaris TaxID=2954799 RepID=A0A9X2JH94_9BACT|nr:UvrD-helicase domain-containing protein [Aeoliella straminimaris]MCO6042674.1 UvrD-helicase domain-containing protein [Aeoliella straminimaris]